MALTIRGEVCRVRAGAAKVGSGDPAPLGGTRVDKHGHRFIVAFAELFNRHFVPLGGISPGYQNGFTTANTTTKIMSIVGASFKNR
jgi:hypothetical protein